VPGASVSYDSWASQDHGFTSESIQQSLDLIAATGLCGPILGDEMLIRWIAIILVANYLLILLGRFFFHWW
jgi:hypothetical protein